MEFASVTIGVMIEYITNWKPISDDLLLSLVMYHAQVINTDENEKKTNTDENQKKEELISSFMTLLTTTLVTCLTSKKNSREWIWFKKYLANSAV